MSEQALIPIDQKTVLFYEDEITAVLVDQGGKRSVVVPLRPLAERLGLDWSAQTRRVRRDPVLGDAADTVVIATPGGRQQMLCLSLDYLNGWLFAIDTQRVKPELRERLIRYQRECYRVLAEAFREGRLSADVDFDALLAQDTPEAQAYKMAAAVLQLARNQLLLRSQLADHEQRLEAIESQLGDTGRNVTPDQASQVSQAVKAVALALGKKSGRNEFGAVYGELYRKFGITGYKMLPARRFDEAMKFLTDWHENLTGTLPF